MSRWTDWVRKWAKDHDTSYGCALTQEDCRAEYHKKYGNRKKLPRKTERELMGMEDKDAGEEIYIIPKKKPKKKKQLIIEEGEINLTPNYKFKKPLIDELKSKLEDKKRLLELSRMMGEDYNALKGKVASEVAKIEKKIKKKKPELIIEEDEEEDVIKNAPKKTLEDFIGKVGDRDPPALGAWKSRNHWLFRRLDYNISAASRKKIMEELGIPVNTTERGIVNFFKAIEEGKTTYEEIEKLILKYNKRLGAKKEVISAVEKSAVPSAVPAKKDEESEDEAEEDDFFKNIDKKELKRLVLEWFDNFIKIRGKINAVKKEWLGQDGLKIIEDFVIMYQRYKKGQPPLENKPVFNFKEGDNFTPDKLFEFIRSKLNQETKYKVGDEILISFGRDLVKITKITPTMITFKYDEKEQDKSFQPTYQQGIQKEGRFKRTFKGKSKSLKPLSFQQYFPKPVPPNFNYEWSEYTDLGF